ncbi:hypothetical protein D9M70_574430 [compost metagenome]
MVDDRGEVGLEHGSDMGRGGDRVMHVLGDSASHAAVGHMRCLQVAGGRHFSLGYRCNGSRHAWRRRGGGGLGFRRCRVSRGSKRGDHIFASQAAAAAAALDEAWIEVVLGYQAAYGR